MISVPSSDGSGSALVLVESMYTLAKGQAILSSAMPGAVGGSSIFSFLYDWNNLRYLMIGFAFLIVAGYQYYKWQARKAARDDIYAGPRKQNSLAPQA